MQTKRLSPYTSAPNPKFVKSYERFTALCHGVSYLTVAAAVICPIIVLNTNNMNESRSTLLVGASVALPLFLLLIVVIAGLIINSERSYRERRRQLRNILQTNPDLIVSGVEKSVKAYIEQKMYRNHPEIPKPYLIKDSAGNILEVQWEEGKSVLYVDVALTAVEKAENSRIGKLRTMQPPVTPQLTFPEPSEYNIRSSVQTLKRLWEKASAQDNTVENEFILEQIVVYDLPETYKAYSRLLKENPKLRKESKAIFEEQISLMEYKTAEIVEGSNKVIISNAKAHTRYLRDKFGREADSFKLR